MAAGFGAVGPITGVAGVGANLTITGNLTLTSPIGGFNTTFTAGVGGSASVAAWPIDYGEALQKSILYFEAQRSGKLPRPSRFSWRGDSALTDGQDVLKDLTGGYYDAGDLVKFGLPMAFSMKLLAWGVLEFASDYGAELGNALEAIKWGTDYFLKCWDNAAQELYIQVGDGNIDHKCWVRPEMMTAPRPSLKISPTKPGADVAGQTSAALAAASLVFKAVDPVYSDQLLTAARQICAFAMTYRGKYSDSIPEVKKFYTSTSGDVDEVLACNAWLLRATGEAQYLAYVTAPVIVNSLKFGPECSWDDNNAAAQVLLATVASAAFVAGNTVVANMLAPYTAIADRYVCFVASQAPKTPGGLHWMLEWAPNQYVGTATLLSLIYTNRVVTPLTCGLTSDQVHSWVDSQAQYILGKNPLKMSYMVGYGVSYPQRVHHRGASIADPVSPAGSVLPSDVFSCNGGWDAWYYIDRANPNVLIGAIVGGPDFKDGFLDGRDNYQQNEATIYINAAFAGVFARLCRK
ncbi:hypothetical protein CBR_g31886 [Chara braunii]|uniref:Endoglucanase n=1 Tax=Chara braunii TaxID=69332 RepID=A0A388LFY0_CHABU|nr:hypothetical protein CBR_g31886 [Chara braunii]|eukprot:GBG81214.1 hypothetical protein CBR_g31886 [Chara braunii]